MKKILATAVVALAVCACSTPLTILHVNDTHSHLEPIKGGEFEGRGGIIERAAIVDAIRCREGASRVLLLHAGDFNQGTSYYTQFDGKIEVAAFNIMGYDCLTLGNHEFDNGIEDLAERLSHLNCPVVCANIDTKGTPLEGIVFPCAVLERAGRQIGIIGLTSDLAKFCGHEISDNLPMYDNVDVVNHWAAHLIGNEGCDFVILLSHLGFEEDKALIPQIHGVNVVIGGHSHTVLDDMVKVRDADKKKVPVVTAGYWGLEIGKLTVY